MRFSFLGLCLAGVLLQADPRVAAHSKAPDGIRYVSAVEDAVINTRSRRVNHLSDFALSFSLHNRQQRVRLDLTPNHDIFGESIHVQHLDSQGNVKYAEEIRRHDHKVFKGSVFVEAQNGEWDEVGIARIYLKEDGHKPLMEGSFSILGDHHHVQLRSTYSKMRRRSDVGIQENSEESMIVYRDSDMVSNERREDSEPTCGADGLSFNSDSWSPLFRPRSNEGVGSFYSPTRRQSGNIGTGNLRATIGDSTGCPTDGRVALIGMATDCTYTASFANEEAVRQNLIQVVNSASEPYERQFGITLGLRNITISDAECPSSPAASTPWNMPCSQGDIETRLDTFSQWRGALGDDNAYWTMMSTCSTDRSVGLAWLGQLCVSTLTGYGGQSVSGANVVVRTAGEWQVFAHESAHTFGAVHDCDSSQCAGSSTTSRCCPISSSGCDAEGAYLMSPVSGRGLTEFSPCTIGNICSNLGSNRVRDSCLTRNRNLTTITGSQCGNGIVEAGEDCDCGGTDGCAGNQCCDPNTCRFIGNSVCDDSNDSCCTSCQFTPANTVCRASTGVCDREETCTGSDPSCPQDSFLPNGESCGNESGLACASGQCTSRDLQCQSVFDTMGERNFTRACDTNSCSLTCVSSAGGGLCASMDQNFLDGTGCGNGRMCSNGRCSSQSSDDDNDNDVIVGGGGGGGEGDSIRSWFDRNRNLVIGLAAGLGSLFLLLVLWCVLCCCRKRRRRKTQPPLPPRPMVVQSGQWQSYPPPVYTPGMGGGGYDPRLPIRATSFRYA